MPHVDSHTPATINWVDFVSTDLEAATGFYTGLFGWETEDMPMPGGEGIYRFFRLGGRDAAAGGTMPAEMAAQGIPSHWNVWVATGPLEAPGINYATWRLGDRTVGGMLEMNEQWEGIPSSWMVYFAVGDTDEAAKRATELGGSVGAPPFDTAYGRIAVLADPAGGHFSVLTPARAAAG